MTLDDAQKLRTCECLYEKSHKVQNLWVKFCKQRWNSLGVMVFLGRDGNRQSLEMLTDAEKTRMAILEWLLTLITAWSVSREILFRGIVSTKQHQFFLFIRQKTAVFLSFGKTVWLSRMR